MLTQQSAYRWLVLICYMLVAAISQMLWLNFAPITETIVNQYHVSLLKVGLLTLSFPFFYTLLSIPAGLLIDRYGYKKILSYSAILMSIFTSIRAFDNSFYWMLYGQIGIAIIQPCIINSISKLVNDWFEEDQAALATGLGTIGMFSGILISLGISAIFTDHFGLKNMLLIFSAFSWLSTILFILFVKNNKQKDFHPTLESSSTLTIKKLFKTKQLLLLFFISFLTQGAFNSLMTWIQPILSESAKITEDQVGLAGALLIMSGIIGSIFIPLISDKLARRKPFLITIGFFSSLLIYLFTSSHSFTHSILFGSLLGFIFLPGFAILLTMTEESVEKPAIGTATGIIMMMGNAGAVTFSIMMQQLNSVTHSWLASNLLASVLILIAMSLCFGLKEKKR